MDTLEGLRGHVYVLMKIFKFCTGSSAKSYQCKFAVREALLGLSSRRVAAEELGKAIQEVIRYPTLRGRFSSVHPELRREGIVRVDVGENGLHFIRESRERLDSSVGCEEEEELMLRQASAFKACLIL